MSSAVQPDVEISVIIPVHNAEAFLAKCLDSLARQTFRKFEVVAVDDCSTDGSRDVLSQFGDRFEGGLRVANSAGKLGPGGARNVGIRSSRGRYLVFVDADDWVEAEMLERLHSSLEASGADVAVCDHYNFDGEGKQLSVVRSWPDSAVGKGDPATISERIAVGSGVLWATMIRRSLFTDFAVTFAERTTSSDMLCRYIWCLSDVVVRVPEPLYTYRRDNESIERSRNNYEHLINSRRVLTSVVDLLREQGLYEEHRDAVDFFFVRDYYVVPIVNLLFRFDRPMLRELREMRDFVRTNFPAYRSNRFFASLSWKRRVLSRANDIAPALLCHVVFYGRSVFGPLLPWYFRR